MTEMTERKGRDRVNQVAGPIKCKTDFFVKWGLLCSLLLLQDCCSGTRKELRSARIWVTWPTQFSSETLTDNFSFWQWFDMKSYMLWRREICNTMFKCSVDSAGMRTNSTFHWQLHLVTYLSSSWCFNVITAIKHTDFSNGTWKSLLDKILIVL